VHQPLIGLLSSMNVRTVHGVARSLRNVRSATEWIIWQRYR